MNALVGLTEEEKEIRVATLRDAQDMFQMVVGAVIEVIEEDTAPASAVIDAVVMIENAGVDAESASISLDAAVYEIQQAARAASDTL